MTAAAVRHLHAAPGMDLLTREPAPSLAELGGRQDAVERTCPDCAVVCPAAMPDLAGVTLLRVDGAGGLYGHLAVRVRGEWRLRPVADGEHGVPLHNRRGVHRCLPATHRCQTPGHGDRVGRLTAGGPFCPACLEQRAAARR